MRSIARRDTGEGWAVMLERLAVESGIATPSADQLRQFDRTRKGKKVSNDEWASPVDPDARITRMKDGRTRLAYKPEHAVDLDTGAIIAAPVHPGDAADTATLAATLEMATDNLAARGVAPTAGEPAEAVADKGYHSRDLLKLLARGPWKTRIAEPRRHDVLRWHGDEDARRAVHGNRRRLLSGVAKRALALRAVLCERSFAHLLDRGGMRRTWLRGRDNVAKRYLVHVAGHNLGLLMRALLGAGTPRAAADLRLLGFTAGDHALLVLLGIARTGSTAPATPAVIAVVIVMPDHGALSTGC